MYIFIYFTMYVELTCQDQTNAEELLCSVSWSDRPSEEQFHPPWPTHRGL